uniref:WD_REPEATS_REGION domain-containing protein n=1 Tax=Strongyloides papillosus TaxID=174720 RepID=A0A0N5CIL6_STREA
MGNPIVTYVPKGIIFSWNGILLNFLIQETPTSFYLEYLASTHIAAKLIILSFLQIEENLSLVFDIDFSPCGKCIIAGSDCGEVIYYYASSGNIIKKFFSNHDSFVGNVTFKKKYLMLASGGRNVIWWAPDYYDKVFGDFD